jgi:hypothetical protein
MQHGHQSLREIQNFGPFAVRSRRGETEAGEAQRGLAGIFGVRSCERFRWSLIPVNQREILEIFLDVAVMAHSSQRPIVTGGLS